jgi:cell division protein FtsZ
MINVDFSHIRRLIQAGGGSLMAIGQGKGEGKAIKAIEQATHHPLLRDISLENAAGVIVNFTGGADLTLVEVETALAHLHTLTGFSTETVLGVKTDDNFTDKAQAILVITGLGAPTLEDTLRNVEIPKVEAPAVRKISQPVEPELKVESVREPITVSSLAWQQTSLSPGADYLDVPAFLRRRVSPKT